MFRDPTRRKSTLSSNDSKNRHGDLSMCYYIPLNGLPVCSNAQNVSCGFSSSMEVS